MSDKKLVHATCVSVNGQGVLISGPSGAGKTQTALAVYRRAAIHRVTCHFVSDDQTFLEPSDDPPGLKGTCPPAIFGKIEIFGFGIVEDPSMFCTNAQVSLAVDLVDRKDVARLAPSSGRFVYGFKLQHLLLPAGKPDLCATAILAAILGHARF